MRRRRNDVGRTSMISLVDAELMEANKIKLTYNNGISGVVDFYPIFMETIRMLDCPECAAEYKKYLEHQYFKRFKFDLNFLHWDYKIAYNTDVLYSLCVTGEKVPEFLKRETPQKIEMSI